MKLVDIQALLILIGTVFVILFLFFGLPYANRYTYINQTTVERGLFFKNTVDLTQYIKIGEGSGLFGHYELYKFKHGSTKPISVYK